MNNYLIRKIAQVNFKDLMLYMLVLVAVTLVLITARFNAENSLVVYAQQLEKPDFIQVFIPEVGAYSERNSKRSIVFGRSNNAVKVILPRKPLSHVRIDPANDSTKTLISKIKLKYLFGTKVYTPDDLITYSKSIQMIDELEVTPEGLIIHSSGNDPILELKLSVPSLTSQLMDLFLISFLISIAAFWIVTRLRTERSRLWGGVIRKYLLSVPDIVYLIAIPFIASLMVAMVFYPGAMSYDTLHGIRGARNGVVDSMWPPMVSYVWRAVDLVSLNPSAMHFSQIFILLYSVFYIIFKITKKITIATLFLIVFLSIPAVLGTMAVIWKDVLMASFFMAGLALIFYLKSVTCRWKFNTLFALTTMLIFIGISVRHNAITGAVPLLFYLSWVVISSTNKHSRYLYLKVFLLGSFLTGATFGAKSFLDTHSLPSFEKMTNHTGGFVQAMRILDVAGASLCVGENLYAEQAQHITLADIDTMYDPKHVNLSASLLARPELKINIDERWWSIALHHPICFLSNKYNLTRYMIGANEGGQFLITHPRIDENEFGYMFKDSSVRDAAFLYIGNVSHVHLLKPWFIYLLSIIGFFLLWRIKSLSAVNFTIFMSGYFYFAGLVMFGSAADARLLFYTTTTLSIFVFISLLEIMKWKKLKK